MSYSARLRSLCRRVSVPGEWEISVGILIELLMTRRCNKRERAAPGVVRGDDSDLVHRRALFYRVKTQSRGWSSRNPRKYVFTCLSSPTRCGCSRPLVLFPSFCSFSVFASFQWIRDEHIFKLLFIRLSHKKLRVTHLIVFSSVSFSAVVCFTRKKFCN